MLFERADGAHSGSISPCLALGCIPFTGQVLERIVGGFQLGCFLGALGRHDAAVLGCAVAQFSYLAPCLFTAQLMVAGAVASKPQPRPFAVSFFVA